MSSHLSARKPCACACRFASYVNHKQAAIPFIRVVIPKVCPQFLQKVAQKLLFVTKVAPTKKDKKKQIKLFSSSYQSDTDKSTTKVRLFKHFFFQFGSVTSFAKYFCLQLKPKNVRVNIMRQY